MSDDKPVQITKIITDQDRYPVGKLKDLLDIKSYSASPIANQRSTSPTIGCNGIATTTP